MANLTSLPTEMVEEVLSWLPVHDQANFVRVSIWTCLNTVPYMYRMNRQLDNSSAIRRSVKLESVAGIRRSLQQQLNANDVDATRQTALHHAIRCRAGFSLRNGTRLAEIIDALLEGGANPTLKDANHKTPFELACEEENYAAALILLDKQAAGEIDLRLNGRALNRALHHVVQPLGHFQPAPLTFSPAGLRRFRRDYRFNLQHYRTDQRELLRRLLAMPGARVNGRTDPNGPARGQRILLGLTLLHASLVTEFTAEHGRIMPDIEVVRILLAAGAKPNATTHPNDGETATPLDMVTDLARAYWHEGMIDGAARIPTHKSPSERDLADLVKLLVSYGARLDALGTGAMATLPINHAARVVCTHGPAIRPDAYPRCLAVVRAMLALKGPKHRTAENPRPATWGILTRRDMDWTVEQCLENHLGGDPWQSAELMGLFKSHGSQVRELELLDREEEESDEGDGDSDGDDEESDSSNDDSDSDSGSEYGPRRKRARTGNATIPAPDPALQPDGSPRRTRSGRMY